VEVSRRNEMRREYEQKRQNAAHQFQSMAEGFPRVPNYW
jgi:hypothetical protein